jgi:hypothetical protein
MNGWPSSNNPITVGHAFPEAGFGRMFLGTQ